MFESHSAHQQTIENEGTANISFADVHDHRSKLPSSFQNGEVDPKAQTNLLTSLICDSDKPMQKHADTTNRKDGLPGLDLNKEHTKEKSTEKTKVSDKSELPPIDGKVSDMTGPGITDKWGVTSTDLGVSIVAPNGKLISVFGDTFSGGRVGEGDWRSPVALTGTGDANHLIKYDSAAGGNPDYAKQLIDYIHDDPNSGWSHGGISTIIPDDLLRVGNTIYLHGIENHGFGNVVRTGIWSSDDSGKTWQHVTEFPGGLDNGYAQCWSWDYNPDDGYVYIASTGFQRDKGIILSRVRPEDIGHPDKYSGWGYANGKWSWDQQPTPITPPGETWGELSLRRLGPGQWLLGGFESSQYALGYRTIASPTANLWTTPVQNPVVGADWNNEDPAHNRVAQLYGGFVLPGSQLDKAGGVGLVVSQWNTATGQPYKAMQFKVTLQNTIGKSASETKLSNSDLGDRSGVYDNDAYMRARNERDRARQPASQG